MKKVVLLGDSIRLIGYGEEVEKRLSGDFSVWQSTNNDRYAKHTYREIVDLDQELADVDIVHWNNGLWDIQIREDGEPLTPLSYYVYDMTRIAKFLKTRAKVVIFATTTPVNPDNETMHNAEIDAYNAAVVPVLRELGVVINDLNAAVSKNVPRYICEDLVHLSAEGITLCASLVENAIRTEAEKM